MVDTAVILAAGLGSRLKDRTQTMPKGFLPVGGKTLIERSVAKLLAAGIKRIIVGTGHVAEYYESFAGRVPGMVCIQNPKYRETGSMYTLYNLRSAISADFLLLESDLLYDADGLRTLLDDPAPDVILASGPTLSHDEVFIETDPRGNLVNMSKNSEALNKIDGELVGITKISYPTFRTICRYAETEFPARPKLDYEYALVAVSSSVAIRVKKLSDYTWCEIDDENHLRRAETLILPKMKESEIK